MSTLSAENYHHDDDDQQQQGLIVPMDTGSIQRIVAGQAVTDLASAVKELVDNALDAGAKTINIRLFNQGIDVVEVSDDGSGVPISSRSFMARKHATSKIRTFEDIYDSRRQTACTTLGFRGEALFCLANLSENLVVVTRTKDDELGQKMEYQRDGELRQDSVTFVPRKIGTTVAVGKLFHPLPVRRADLIKRIKAQRAKVVSMIQGYGILCLGVRFNLIDVVKKGNGYREEIKLSTTNSSTNVEQTCSSILGSRFLSGMTRISIDLTEALDKDNRDSGSCHVQGLISKAPSLTARDGSVARESQFFSINGRPVELPKVSRAIGDAWRAFEGTKKRPACILCFTLPNNEYDVNLSPDKREVLLTNQATICSSIHQAVTNLWSSQSDGNFTPNAVLVPEKQQQKQRPPTTAVNGHQPFDSTGKTTTTTTIFSEGDTSSPEPSPGKRRRFQRRNAFVHDPSMARTQHELFPQSVSYFHQPTNVPPEEPATASAVTTTVAQSGKHDLNSSRTQTQSVDPGTTPADIVDVELSVHRPVDRRSSLASGQQERPTEEERRQWASVQSRFNGGRHHQDDEIQMALTKGDDVNGDGEPVTPEEPPIVQEETRPKKRASVVPVSTESTDNGATKRTKALTLEDFAFRPTSKMGTSKPRVTREADQAVALKPNESDAIGIDSRKRPVMTSNENRRKRQKASESVASATHDDTRDSEAEEETFTPDRPEEAVVWNSFAGTDAVMKATQEARFSMRQFRKELRDISRNRQHSVESCTTVGGVDDASVADEEQTDAAIQTEEPNVVSLSKEDFRHMTVLGQFNMGFILCKCRNNHLWIMDQHACDEQYNFERLCSTTVIHEQRLIAPMPLELSPMEESCILDNMEVFEENGFRFAHDPDKPPRHQLSLTALPHSGAQDGRKAVQFGKEDVLELCAMLLSEEGYSQDGGTGADGSGMYGNNAVRRHAGVSQTQDTASKVIARLPKAIAMFANRACRGSIMIGTALSQKEMDTVVKRLADVESPWNCPHGRPTMRHVKDLMGIMTSDEERAASLIAGPTMAVMTQNTNSQDEEEGA